MEPLYQLLTALLSANAPWWLLAIIAAAILLRQVGPIHLNLSIGDCTKLPSPPASPAPERTLLDNTAPAQLQK